MKVSVAECLADSKFITHGYTLSEGEILRQKEAGERFHPCALQLTRIEHALVIRKNTDWF